jgi:Family of unknown function (DUF6600)/FecR protein
MKNIIWVMIIALLGMVMISPEAFSQSEDTQASILVGRISHIEGQLLRYVPSEKDWVVTVPDAPFGFEDALYSERGSRAEVILPNNTWVRINGDTQVQLLNLKEDLTEIDVGSGVARFYNKSQGTQIRATNPFGYILAAPGTVFDCYVGDRSMELVAVKGTVTFYHGSQETRFEVPAGSTPLVADQRIVSPGERAGDPAWEQWNRQRDDLWAQRFRTKGDSSQYLPGTLQDQAYLLDENGRWDRVYYEGGYNFFWRPLYISAGWAPFTVGRWTLWYDDHCWIPHEPFGYVTHHYGNWVFVKGFWYWAPPVVRVRAVPAGPFLGLGFAWYPGRVQWIHSGSYIGWIPLAPFEPYYCHRHWGPRVRVIHRGQPYPHPFPIDRFRYYHHATVVRNQHFYTVNDYHQHRVAHVTPASIKSFAPAPVLDNRVIPQLHQVKESHQFTSRVPAIKPQPAALDRIQHNERQRQIVETRPKEVRPVDRVEPIHRGKPGPEEKIEPPKPPVGGQTGRDFPRPKEVQPIKPTPAKEGIKERQVIPPPKPKFEPSDARGGRDRIPYEGLKPDKPGKQKEWKPEKVRVEPPVPMDRPQGPKEERPRTKPVKPEKGQGGKPRELTPPPREVDHGTPKASPGKGMSSPVEGPIHQGRPVEGASQMPPGKQPGQGQPHSK